MFGRIFDQTARARDTDANDTILSSRLAHYVDSTGARTGKVSREVRLYNNTGGATVKNKIYMLTYTGNAASSPQVVAAATATPARRLCVAKEVIANGAVGWFCVAGWTDAAVEGTTDVAAGDFLKLTSGTTATAFIKDGTTYSTSSHAVAGAAQTANSEVDTLVELIGDPALVA